MFSLGSHVTPLGLPMFFEYLITSSPLLVAPPATHPFLDHHTMALCPKVPFVKGPLAILQLGSSLCICKPLLSKGLCSKSLLSKDLQVLALGQVPFAKGPATSLFCQERCSAHKITRSCTNDLWAPLLLLWSDDSFPFSSWPPAKSLCRDGGQTWLSGQPGVVCHQHLWSHTCTASRVAS